MSTAAQTIFVTGSDTGVGKTVLTALLLARLCSRDPAARALKPFCTGDRSDAELLAAISNERNLDRINPWFWPEPVAPMLAAQNANAVVPMRDVLDWIKTARPATSSPLLIEGAGGLLSPLPDNCTALDFILELNANAIVVIANKLGAINQARLVDAALPAGVSRTIVLMGAPSVSEQLEHTNFELIADLIPRADIFSIPYLGANASQPERIKQAAQELSLELDEILNAAVEHIH